MPKKCPDGVFCIENYTMFFLFLIGCGILYYLINYKPNTSRTVSNNNPISNNMPSMSIPSLSMHSMSMPSLSIPSLSMPILSRPVMPINIPTQQMGNGQYSQVGILTRINGPETILPLMGRQLIVGRDTWNYYTMNENMIRLPISFKNKNCDGEYGCDNIFNGDTVYVEGLNDAFRATIYENNGPRYIPYI